ncbi:hypothetical protein [Qingshengfaniella alkalisoli]|uniref:Uncharacterized protein n=1 Tax=Qingshengfaniella alkalisoli TaxID=2599296 RepID=A0A5B8I8Q6_9RHOB|nr:hypothetical protein [Qingshengfaniella alkalisoli]QDY70149.1 hypothetical protein FPZ52_11300 [Qingshengfaniella alkalisoli]
MQRAARQLLQAAELKRDDALARLSELRNQIAGTRSRISELREGSSSHSFALEYARAGFDDRHALWRDQEVKRLNLELAQLRAGEDGLKKQAGRSLGRLQVLQRILAERG